jgi:hypothetical protein
VLKGLKVYIRLLSSEAIYPSRQGILFLGFKKIIRESSVIENADRKSLTFVSIEVHNFWNYKHERSSGFKNSTRKKVGFVWKFVIFDAYTLIKKTTTTIRLYC